MKVLLSWRHLVQPTVSIVTLESQEQPWLFGIATGKSARTKPVENMWHLPLSRKTMVYSPSMPFLGACQEELQAGRVWQLMGNYQLIKQQNSHTSSLSQCSALSSSTMSCLQLLCLNIHEKYTEVWNSGKPSILPTVMQRIQKVELISQDTKNNICKTVSLQKVINTTCRWKSFNNPFWILLMVSFDFWEELKMHPKMLLQFSQTVQWRKHHSEGFEAINNHVHVSDLP